MDSAEVADIERVARVHVRLRPGGDTAARARAHAANALLWRIAAWRSGRRGPRVAASLLEAWGRLREQL